MKLGICTITDGGNAVYPSCIANMVNSLDLLDYDMHWYIHQNGVEDDLPEVAAVSVRDDTTTTRSADYRGISKNRNDLAQAALDDGCGAVIWIDDDIVVPWVDEGVAISRDGGWIDGLLTPLEADAAVFAVGLSPCVCTEDFNTMWYVPVGDGFHYQESPYSMRLSMWSELGRYDEEFTVFCDNTDICLKARLAGYSLVSVENTEGVLHYQGRTVARYDFMEKNALNKLREVHHAIMIARYPEGWHASVGCDCEHIQKRARVLDFVNPREIRT